MGKERGIVLVDSCETLYQFQMLNSTKEQEINLHDIIHHDDTKLHRRFSRVRYSRRLLPRSTRTLLEHVHEAIKSRFKIEIENETLFTRHASNATKFFSLLARIVLCVFLLRRISKR